MTELVLKFENEIEAEAASNFLVNNYRGVVGSNINTVERVGDTIFFTNQISEAPAPPVEEAPVEEAPAELDLGMDSPFDDLEVPTSGGEGDFSGGGDVDVSASDEAVPTPVLPEVAESNVTPELPADEFAFPPVEAEESLREHLEDIRDEAEEALENLDKTEAFDN